METLDVKLEPDIQLSVDKDNEEKPSKQETEKSGPINQRLCLTLDQNDIKFCPKCGKNLMKEGSEKIQQGFHSYQRVSMDTIESHFKACDISISESSKKSLKKQCKSCHKNFASQATLEQHRFFCDPSSTLAGFVASKTDTKEKVKQIKTKKRPTVECPICHKVLNQKAYLANHMNTHTGDRPHKCRFCGKGFKDYSSLRTHHQSHQDIRPYQCNTCEKAYRRPDDLKKHELTHLGIKPHVCSFCAKGFRSMSTLKNHESKAHGDPKDVKDGVFTTYLCEKCEVPEVFNSRSSLRDHEIRQHGRPGDILKCDYENCSKDFTNPALLRAHKRTHTDERPFGCPFCDIKFKTKFHMENHSKRHTKGSEGEKYLCLICAEGFSNAEMLKTHCKTHDTESVEKPKYAVWYACELCKKKFIRADLLNKHMKSHEMYQCSQCDTTFMTLEALNVHEREHFDLIDIDIGQVAAITNVEDFFAVDVP